PRPDRPAITPNMHDKTRSETMNRFLTTTAVGLLLGLAPAMAQDPPAADEGQTPPAVNAPLQIPAGMPDPAPPAPPAQSPLQSPGGAPRPRAPRRSGGSDPRRLFAGNACASGAG